jgi:hypothetical protein
MLQIRQVEGKGRGVFAGRKFVSGETVERSPVIVFSQTEIVERTDIQAYYYFWGDGGCLGLGLISLYNHSSIPNMCFIKHYDSLEMEMRAIRDIEVGEELTVDYREDYPTACSLWFEEVS